MPSMNIADFGDLLTVTLSAYDTPNYTSLITDLVDHPAAKKLIKKSKMSVGSGKNCITHIQMGSATSFANIAITDHDSVNITDGFVDSTIDWKKSGVKYAFYEEERDINMTPSRLVDLIKAREAKCMGDWIEGLERNFWGFPAATDVRTPFGLPYWNTKNATTGFNGGTPSGYTTVGGINPTTYPRWNNYTAQHTNVSFDDLIRKVRIMGESTDFKPPVEVPDPTSQGATDRGYFTNLTNKVSIEDLAQSQNENVGNDVAKFDNQVTLRRLPVNYVPLLDLDTTNPFYQIDWRAFGVKVKSGWWQKRTVLAPYPGQRNVVAVFIDSIYQFVCMNRRLLGVIATGTTYPS